MGFEKLFFVFFIVVKIDSIAFDDCDKKISPDTSPKRTRVSIGTSTTTVSAISSPKS